MTDLYCTSLRLRAVAHVLHYADYIHEITGDVDFPCSLIDVMSDYLYFLADECNNSFDKNDECQRNLSIELKQLRQKLEQMEQEKSV